MTEPQNQPHDLDAERAVLGSMMLNPTVVDDVAAVLTDGAFYDPRHARLYTAIVAAAEDGDPVEPAAVTARLVASGDIGRVGGADYVHDVVHAVGAPGNATWYAGKLRSLALARGLATTAARAHEWAHTIALDQPAEAIERIRGELDTLETGNARHSDLAPWDDVLQRGLLAMESAETPDSDTAPVATGFADLDRLLAGGLRQGQLVIVAGRTSMGKSLLARNVACAAAFRQKLTTALFSLEMTETEVFNAIVAAELGISLQAIQDGTLSDADWTKVARFAADSADTPLHIADASSASLADIRHACRQLKRRHGLDLVVVDYLQLLNIPTRENRQVGVAELARQLKQLAGELGCPVVALSQLNRGPENRPDKRPSLGDLRESGDIENSANTVILVYREDYYDHESPRQGEADLIVAKNRSGPKDTVTVAAQLHYGRFVSMAPEPTQGAPA